MPNLTLSGSPARVGALSVWSGYMGAYGEINYTVPGVDGAYCEFVIGDALKNARFQSAHLTYTLTGGAGTRHIRFEGGAYEATDARILDRLNAGETKIRLYFSFRAQGGSGLTGSHSATCEWSNIALELEYALPGAVSGSLSLDGSASLNYAFDKSSALLGDKISFTLTGSALSNARSAKICLGGEDLSAYDEVSPILGDGADALSGEIEVNNALLQSRIANAKLKLKLTYADSFIESEWTETNLKLCKSYIAPSVNCIWSDTSGVYERFGVYVQGKSNLCAAISADLDAQADVNVSCVKRSLTLGSRAYELGGDSVDTGKIDECGSVYYSASVTDSHSLTGSASGSLNVCAYSAPVITRLSLERYSVSVNEQGENVYEADEGSPMLRLYLSARVSEVNQSNAWTLAARYSTGLTEREISIASGTDGGDIVFEADRSAFSEMLSVQSEWEVFFTLTDGFESATYSVIVPKAGAILNIEKGGVAVGMRCTGTKALPKFEVNYPAAFYNDVSFEGIDSGWLNVNLASGVSEYDNDWRVRARRIGDMAFVRGGVRLAASLASGAGGSTAGVIKLMDLPSECRPAYPMEFAIIPDRTQVFLRMRLDIDGSLTLYNRSGYQMGAGELVCVNMSFIAN